MILNFKIIRGFLMSEILKFINNVDKILIVIKKLDRDTNSNYADMEVFLDSSSKKFLNDYKTEIQKLFDMRIQRELVSFISFHVWKKGKNGHNRSNS
jgi:hypothetical protein